ncbi:cyanophycin synthetase [Sulfoacidibacillus ferrooxidans]|uniref:Cyanophycin synthetase n=1 Tax=Sulfoacidibacillus ferrooxidans TaxID=2005001 RepID=A0A9X1V9L1_9BACL|nr:Cyanophycin synthetase [Sulfoacidibacillus ferrooxidans]
MKVVHLRAIHGPNVYIYKPVLIMRLDLEEYTDRESYEFPELTSRLLQMCPGLYEHYCGMGRRGGFVERLYGGTYLGHVIEHVTLELLTQIGYKTNFGKTRSAGQPGLYDVVIEFETEEPARYLLMQAVMFVDACAKGIDFPLQEVIEEARQLRKVYDLGPSTQAIVDAALRRHIPVQRMGRSLVRLGTGRYRKYVQATMTHHTSGIAVDIASDKALTKHLLEQSGIRVPHGAVVQTLEEAVRVFYQLGSNVVIKPFDGCQGRGVSTNISNEEMLADAYSFAVKFSPSVIIEEYAKGKQYRLLVVSERLVAAAERIPAHVIGDGMHTINELIMLINEQPERGDDHEKPLTKIVVDEMVQRYLTLQNWNVEDIPEHGQMVLLRDSANLSTGGIAVDCTEQIDPAFAQLAVRAARTIGLDVCGVDIIAPNICDAKNLDQAVVIEVNAAPGIRMHHYPSLGKSHDVGAAILESLYPLGAASRIPIVSITGTNGKTTTTRMIRHILQFSGYNVGMTSTEGVYIGDHKVLSGDTTGPQSAQVVLTDPTVDVAVLETARGGIMRGGLAYDVADVGIITNIALDHIGQDGITSLDDLVNVKALVAECVKRIDGAVILSADDPTLVALAQKLKQNVVYVSIEENNPIVTRHLARGMHAFYFRDGWLIEAAGALEWKIVRADELPITLQATAMFHVANALCAIAAARHLGISRKRCAMALTQFRSDLHNSGRINIFRLPSGTHVICDYGHNPDGIRVVGEMAQRITGKRIPAIVGFPGDRDDSVICQSAHVAVQYFEPLFIKEDEDKRGRKPGEVAALLAQEIRKVAPEACILVELDELEALRKALIAHGDEPFILMFHENLDHIREFLVGLGGKEVYALPEVKPVAAFSAM